MTIRSLALAVALAWAAAPAAADAQAARPNVLLILTDDQGWGDLGSHGNPELRTPVLDRLATEGARFQRFYVTPLCAPTRAGLLTGRDHLRGGVTDVTGAGETLRADEVTLAEVFRAAGYRTGIFGKWHNGEHYPTDPHGQGFDEFLGFSGGHWNEYFDPVLRHNGTEVRTRGYITDVLTEGAIHFIRANRDRPFLAYLPYNAPHGPFQLPDSLFDRYRARGLDEKTAAVYGMVENLDSNIGRLLATLDELGLRERTIVAYLHDNGPNGERFNGGMRGTKGSVHEGGVRSPLFLRWPGRIPAGREIRPITSHLDLLPTLADLAGVPLPRARPLDGVSLVPLLAGQSAGWPDRRLFTQRAKPDGEWKLAAYPGTVRTERWRAVRTGAAWELYDMERDPAQRRDVAAEQPAVTRELAAAYDRWFAGATRAGIRPPPIEVGHPAAPRVRLPATEAELGEGLRFANRTGWAHDWLTGWDTTADAASWEIEVVRPGRYEVALMHTAPAAAVGTVVRVEVAGRAARVAIPREVAHEPGVRPDRVPGDPRLVKPFHPLVVGTLDLPRGRTRLRVQVEGGVPGGALDLESVLLRRLGDLTAGR